MKRVIIVATLLAGVAAQLGAQQPDSVRARQIRDSIELVRELERMRGDTTRRAMGPQLPPINPRLMPDLSAIADIVGDLSPKGSTQEDATRFAVREVELAIAANVDPYFRADFILGLSDEEGIAIEEAYGTALALPWQLQARIGRFHMPVGKQNTTHRAELHTLEYPYVIQRFLGAEGLKGTGLWISKILAPFGFYQELQVTAVDRFGEADENLLTENPPNKDLAGLGLSARLRNYWDFSESTNLELSASAITGKREQPFNFRLTPPAPDVNAVLARQALYGADLTFRWRPLQQGLYKSFIAQAEFIRQLNARDADPDYLGPSRDFSGAYGFARWQVSRRLHVGGRYDWLEDPELAGETFTAGSGYLEWFPSEFSKLVLAYEHAMPKGVTATNRILLQATFAVGPHRPHPF
ncbi:MAG: hypothetical protein WD825_05350 [Gemmatimonadaceae bacterium]